MGQNLKNYTARIYSQHEHIINVHALDQNALYIIKKLQQHNYKAYVVGGAVRDMLLNISPKDFDIATNATPQKIKSIFYNCRIIGKRFRLAHIHFKNNKIIEVATFRSLSDQNVYGNIEEDAYRRDFTINGLYYNPTKQYVIDYVDGYSDLQKGKLTPIIPLRTIFCEDPIRMVRAIKYSCTANLCMDFRLRNTINKNSNLLKISSTSRITEEIIKILLSEHAHEIIFSLNKHNLLKYLQPQVNDLLEISESKKQISHYLREIDKTVSRNRNLTNALSLYLMPLLNRQLAHPTKAEIVGEAKQFIYPMQPPNIILHSAVKKMLLTKI